MPQVNETVFAPSFDGGEWIQQGPIDLAVSAIIKNPGYAAHGAIRNNASVKSPPKVSTSDARAGCVHNQRSLPLQRICSNIGDYRLSLSLGRVDEC